ncbi:MAG: DMT family transporter [Rhodospirillaceae bacterium]
MPRLIGHPYVLLTCAALFWAGAAVVARSAVGEVPPMAINFWRWFFAFFIALTWTWRELRAQRELIARQWKFISFLALTSSVLFGALHFLALQFTTAINGSLFQGMMSICIIVVAWIVLGDRIGIREGAGVALGFTGLAAIVTQGNPSVLLALTVNFGDVLLLIASFSYAVYAVSLRRAPPGLSPSALMTAMFGFSALYMLPVWLIELYGFGLPVRLNTETVLTIGYQTVFPSVLAQIFWATAVARVGPGRAGYFIYLSPVFGVAMSVALLGETFHAYHAAGIVLIFAAIALATRQRR